jgi:osmotically-inducible protein OsmY
MKYDYLFFFSLLLPLTSCTSMVIGGGQQSGEYVLQEGRSLEQVSEDANITQAVRRILTKPSNVSVSTTNGIVTLQGTMDSQREIQRLISQVYRVDGVQDVDSQLDVRTQ